MDTIIRQRSQCIAPQCKSRLSEMAQQHLLLVALIAGDAAALASAFTLAYLIRFRFDVRVFQDSSPAPELYTLICSILIPTWLVIFALFHLYNEQNILSGTKEYSLIFNGCTAGAMIVVVFGFLTPTFVIARGWLILAWLCSFLLVALWRFGLRRLVRQFRNHGYFLHSALVIGANEEAKAVVEQLLYWPASGLRLLGFVDDGSRVGQEILKGLKVVGGVSELEQLITRYGINELIIATNTLSRPTLLEVFRAYGSSPTVRMRMSSGLFEIMTTGVQVKEVGYVSLFSINKVRLTGMDLFSKTMVDYAFIIPGLLVLAPFMLLIALLIKLDSPGPVIYRRRVLGMGGHEFDAFKFRTMYVNGDEILAEHPALLAQLRENHKLKHDPRVTRIGRFLRKSSLDELPQLFNVLRRQMSLVGPRMITPAELEKYEKWGMNLLTIPPGITGLWQISGRSEISYQERVQIDMTYIRNYTIWLDLQILFLTIPAVLKSRGAY